MVLKWLKKAHEADVKQMMNEYKEIGQGLLNDFEMESKKLLKEIKLKKKMTVQVLEGLEIKEGGTYWVIVGDMGGGVTGKELSEVKKWLVSHCPKAKFIVTSPQIRPTAYNDLHRRRKT